MNFGAGKPNLSRRIVISHTTKRFRVLFAELPADVRQLALKAYRLWRTNPFHNSLQFKPIHATQPIYSVRINRNCRAVGIRNGQVLIWFWIGPHADYDTLIKKL